MSLRVIFAGTPNFAVYHLQALISSGYNVIAVFTQPDRASGRGKKLIPSPVKNSAKENKIPVFQPTSLYLQEYQKLITELNADIIVVVAYGLIFPKSILDIPYFGCINVHGSLLPRWRGAAPIQRSICAGDAKSGISIIQMNSGIDTGDILYKISCPISEKETSNTLYNKLTALGTKGLINVLQQIARGEVKPEVQNESLVTYAKKLSKDEAQINWFLPANHIERYIRAFNPFMKTWTRINGQIVKILRASVKQIPVSADPGTIIQASKEGIQIATIEGILNLELLQPSGKRIMCAWDFLNSRRDWLKSGTCLD